MQQGNIQLHQSPLFGLTRKRDLSNILGVAPADLQALKNDNHFHTWIKKQGNKDRLIESPQGSLKMLLSRLHSKLSLIETPDYLLSGKKKIKPQDNAITHLENQYMVTVDIASFYQSTKREYIYHCFKNMFQQSDDVASLLATLVTYNGHVPTGAPTSQLIAYWAYKPTFDRLHKLCLSKGICMSLWVDDITFSSNKPFPANWIQDVQNIVKEVQLSLKMSKNKMYSQTEHKSVTGSAISPNGGLLVKNVKRKEILDLIENKRIEELNQKDAQSLFGKLVSQRQNESDFFDGIYMRLKSHLAALR